MAIVLLLLGLIIQLTLIIFLVLLHINWTRTFRQINESFERLVSAHRNGEDGHQAGKADKRERERINEKTILLDPKTETHDGELESNRDKEDNKTEDRNDFSVPQSVGDSVGGKISENSQQRGGSSQESEGDGSGCDKTPDSVECKGNYKEKTISNTNNGEYIVTESTFSTFLTQQRCGSSQENKEDGSDCNKTRDSVECKGNIQEKIISKTNKGEYIATESTFSTFPTQQRCGGSQENKEDGSDCHKTPDSVECKGNSKEKNIINKTPDSFACKGNTQENVKEITFSEITNEDYTPQECVYSTFPDEKGTHEAFKCDKTRADAKCFIIAEENVQEKCVSQNNNFEFIANESTFSTFPSQQREGNSQVVINKGLERYQTTAAAESILNREEIIQESNVAENNICECIATENTFPTFRTQQKESNKQESTEEDSSCNKTESTGDAIENVKENIISKNNNVDNTPPEPIYSMFPAIQGKGNCQEGTYKGYGCNKHTANADCFFIAEESVQEKHVSNNNTVEFIACESTSTFIISPRQPLHEKAYEGPNCHQTPVSTESVAVPEEDVQENVVSGNKNDQLLDTASTLSTQMGEDNSQEGTYETSNCNKTSATTECFVIPEENVHENIVSQSNNGEVIATESACSAFPTTLNEGHNQESTKESLRCYKTTATFECASIGQESVQFLTDREHNDGSIVDSGVNTDMCSVCKSTEEDLQSNSERKDREFAELTVKEASPSKDNAEENTKTLGENYQRFKPIHGEDMESFSVQDTDVPLDESKVKKSDLESIDESTDTNKRTESIVRDLPEPSCEREHCMTIGANHADLVLCITPRKDDCNDTLSASLRSQVVPRDDGSTSMVSPKVNSSTEFHHQIGQENKFIYADEGYGSLSSLESAASDFGDSMPSLDSVMSSLEFVPEAKIELPEEAESETDSPNTRKTVETGHAQITVPWWRFFVDIRRIFIDSSKQIFVVQIGLDNRVYTDCAGFWTESFECVVKHKGDRIVLCPCCFIFVRFIPSKQFTTKIGQMLQAYSLVASGLAISYETATFEMGRSGNRSKLEPTKDELLTHMPNYLEVTEKDDLKPKFSPSPFCFVDRRPEKQFGGEVIENTICTGEMHFDLTRCNFKRFSATARPRPELDDNENITNVDNYLYWRPVSSNYGENEPYPYQSQEKRVIVQEVLSNETIQTRRGLEPKKSKKESTEAKRSNDQFNVRIRNGEAFEKEMDIGSSTEDGGFNLCNTPVSDHDDQNSVRSTTVQLRLDDGSIPPSGKSKSYQAGRTKLYHRWLAKIKKAKAKTTGRKQCILQHSDIYRKKCNSFTISKKKKLRQVSATDRSNSRSSLKRQVLRRRYHLTNYVKSQVKNRFPKYWLCSGKLDTHFCRIQSKRRQVYMRDVMPKQMRLYLAGSRLCRARKSKGAFDFKSKMKARASYSCCKRSCKVVNTKESQNQTKHTETKTAQTIAKLTRCKIADGQLRSENVCCFNQQIQMFRTNTSVQSANVSVDEKGENSQTEKNPHGEIDFGDIDGRNFRDKSSDDTCPRLSQEDIENILFAKLSKLQSDDFESLFRTIGAIYCFSTENGFVCLLRDFDCWTDEEAMKNSLKRLVLEKIGPIEIYPGVYISEGEDIDVEFTK